MLPQDANLNFFQTTQFRLLNAIAKSAQDLNLPKDHELSPHRFHSDLFLSGIDRILVVSPYSLYCVYLTFAHLVV